MKTKTSSIIQSISSVGTSALSSLDSLAVIQEYVAYLQTVESEQTKRTQIVAQRDVLIAAINSERDTILAYFNHRFSERKAALDTLFLALSEGLKSSNDTIIDSTITGIIHILQDNPLKDLSEFKKNMTRPDFTLEL